MNKQDFRQAIRTQVAALEQGRLHRVGLRLARPLIERIVGIRRLARLYAEIQKLSDKEPITKRLLEAANISIQFDPAALEAIPKSGPIVVVSNHPYGILDGLILVDLFRDRRPDTMGMASTLLGLAPEFSSMFILVDNFTRNPTNVANLGGIRAAYDWLRNRGGVLVIFPAGGISRFFWKQRSVVDPEWNRGIANMVRRSESTVIPAYFEPKNNPLIVAAGTLGPIARTALLGRSLLAKKGKKIRLVVGDPISYSAFVESGNTDQDRIQFLRDKTYNLKAGLPKDPKKLKRWREWRPFKRRSNDGAP